MRDREPHVASTANIEDVCPEDGHLVKLTVNLHKLPNHYTVKCEGFCERIWELEVTLGSWVGLPEFKILWKEDK